MIKWTIYSSNEEEQPQVRIRSRGGVPTAEAPSADTLDPVQLRHHTLEALAAERERCAHDRDRAFLDRLAQALISADLGLPRPPGRGLLDAAARRRAPASWRRTMRGALAAAVARVDHMEAESIGMRACFAAEVAADTAGVSPGAAYLSALFQDVGRLVILAAAGDAHARVVARVDRLHHAAISVIAADAWGLGQAVCAAVYHHHAPERAPAPYQALARSARRGDALASAAWDRRRDATHRHVAAPRCAPRYALIAG